MSVLLHLCNENGPLGRTSTDTTLDLSNSDCKDVKWIEQF